jgi:hypothetical protein
MAKSGVGIPSGILSDSEFLYGKKSPLEGIMSMMPGQQILKGLASKLPVNRRAIFENELSGQGIMVNDIGQIVASPGNINTAENIMAGYNANKITADTFQKRRDMINAKMKDPEQKAAKLKALDEAEAKILGTAKTRTDAVFDMKSLAKDPDYISFDQKVTKGLLEGDEDSKYLDYTNPNIYNTDSIYTQTAPTYITDPYVSGQDDKDIGTTPPGTSDDGYVTDYYGGDSVIDAGGTAPDGGYATDYYGGDSVTDAGGTAPGGGYATDYYGGNSVTDAGGTAPGGGYATDYYGGGNDTGSSYNAGSGYGSGKSSNLGGPAGQGTATAKDAYTDAITRGNTGGGNDSSSNSRDKIVCTMMNESYGFGSFRNKIWMKFHKDLSPEYQKGYHKLFLPLVRIAKTNKVVKKILEHIAVHSTIDMRQATRGKMHLLGRIYRKILLPLCYIVGKHGKSSS